MTSRRSSTGPAIAEGALPEAPPGTNGTQRGHDANGAQGAPANGDGAHDAPARSGAGAAVALVRNPGTALDLDVIEAAHVNRSAVERRAATLPTRRTVKQQWQAAWLLRAITFIDLTTLAGDDTPRQRAAAVREGATSGARVAARGARRGAPRPDHGRRVRLPSLRGHGRAALAGSGIPVAAVSHRIPGGLSPAAERIAEIRASVATARRRSTP
jgi:deoxyribose-phosphate aldolase